MDALIHGRKRDGQSLLKELSCTEDHGASTAMPLSGRKRDGQSLLKEPSLIELNGIDWWLAKLGVKGSLRLSRRLQPATWPESKAIPRNLHGPLGHMRNTQLASCLVPCSQLTLCVGRQMAQAVWLPNSIVRRWRGRSILDESCANGGLEIESPLAVWKRESLRTGNTNSICQQSSMPQGVPRLNGLAWFMAATGAKPLRCPET